MIVDVWMQHPTLRFLRHDMFASLRRWTDLQLPDEDPPIDATVAAMDGAAVDFGLLSAWSAPHQRPLIGNDEVAEWVSAHPTRFAGLAAVDLNRPVEAVRELRRCVTELGFKGLRVVPWLWEAPPTDRRYYPSLTACVELGVPFFAGHIGYPWTEEMVAVARKHEHVYIDTSAYTAKRYPPELVAYMKTNSGRRKVMFGTNYPMLLPGQALEHLDALGLDAETRQLFLAGNAERVLGFPA